jgi:3-hydroxyisobutyrate dehydrogenase
MYAWLKLIVSRVERDKPCPGDRSKLLHKRLSIPYQRRFIADQRRQRPRRGGICLSIDERRDTMPEIKVAVLGAGKMGGAIVRRLHARGFDVSVWDRTRSKAEALRVARVADSPAAATRAADVVLSILTGPQAVRDVYFGKGGVGEGAAGKTLVEMSTAGPDIQQELAKAAALKGATMIEAPVIGSVPAIESGTLVILGGAARAQDLEPARPVLEQLGELHYIGKLGSAAALKLSANSFLAIVSAAAAELMAAGVRSGLSPERIFWVLSRAAPGLKLREAGFVKHTHEPALFAARDMVKDLDLALSLFQGASVPLTSVARNLFAKVAAREPGLDISAIVKAYS